MVSLNTHPIEGVVENGTIRLREGIHLPEKTKVYVIVAENEGTSMPRLRSPKLAHPQQAGDFAKQVFEVPGDAKL